MRRQRKKRALGDVKEEGPLRIHSQIHHHHDRERGILFQRGTCVRALLHFTAGIFLCERKRCFFRHPLGLHAKKKGGGANFDPLPQADSFQPRAPRLYPLHNINANMAVFSRK